MKKKELDSLIKQKTEESGLTGVTIKKKSIQQRVYRKRLLVARYKPSLEAMQEAFRWDCLQVWASVAGPGSIRGSTASKYEKEAKGKGVS